MTFSFLNDLFFQETYFYEIVKESLTLIIKDRLTEQSPKL